MNNQKYFTISDLHIAKFTLALKGQKDKNGNDLVSLPHLLWAAKVVLWFSRLTEKIRKICKSFRIAWCHATKYVWGRLRSGIEKISLW